MIDCPLFAFPNTFDTKLIIKSKMFNKLTLILFCILLGIKLNGAEKYKTCSIHKLNCPASAVCAQRNSHDQAGDCKCTGDNEFNAAYHNDSDYCIPIPVMRPTTAVGGGSSSKLDKVASELAHNQSSNSHHIIGIIIPLFLVLFVIGVTYGVKKLHIVKRVRDIMAARRSRPFYEDVMMSNENDDPPLI